MDVLVLSALSFFAGVTLAKLLVVVTELEYLMYQKIRDVIKDWLYVLRRDEEAERKLKEQRQTERESYFNLFLRRG